jgi:hypothetical protein
MGWKSSTRILDNKLPVLNKLYLSVHLHYRGNALTSI